MSTRTGAIEAFAGPLRPNLEALVRNLDRDTARSKRLIRQCLEEDPDSFLRSAMAVLKEDRTSAGAQHLIAAIVAAGLLVPALCDRQLSRDEAIAVAQMAGRFDSKLEATIARRLSDSVEGAGDEEADHVRLIEILTAISDGVRIFPSLVRLLRHPNAHIRSKAVLTIGRGNRSAAWVRQKLSDSDPRIRANAAEALWHVESDEARELLEQLMRDSNNRVAGNAMVGLYRLGNQAAIPEILGMARHESALFRATAAWAMGATGDPRFTEPLAGLLRETHGVVRKRAFAALGSIRAAVTRARQAAPWRVFARAIELDSSRGRRIAFGMAREDGVAPPVLKATQVLLNEDGRNVAQYRLMDRPLPETMSYVFLLPRSGAEAARACLRWKRATDLWAVVYYGTEASTHARLEGAPRFYSAPDAIEAELARVPAEEDCGDLWQSVRRAAALDTGGIPGKRQVIIWNERPQSAAASDELAAGTAAQAFVQAISAEPDGALAEFCRRIKGVYGEAGADALIEACLHPLARYEVVYQPSEAKAELLRLRLHGPGLWGEAAVRLR